jgi:L-aspartate oxidase
VPIAARATILATGGAAALWERTTNPRGAIGAGLTLAEDAGATLADLEMTQFHPTALVHGDPVHDGFLITEAIRGEGAVLLDPGGERFVDELAPRDQVALAVEAVRRQRGEVRLDMRSIDMTHFPNVLLELREAGVDPEDEDPVAVMTVAVATYLAYRRTELERDREHLLRLAARAEFDGKPPEHVARWLAEQGVEP